MANMLHEIYRECNMLGYAICNKVYLEWLILYFTGNTVTLALWSCITLHLGAMTSGTCFEDLETSENVIHSSIAAVHQKVGFIYKVSEFLWASSFSYLPLTHSIGGAEDILSVFEKWVWVCLLADILSTFSQPL